MSTKIYRMARNTEKPVYKFHLKFIHYGTSTHVFLPGDKIFIQKTKINEELSQNFHLNNNLKKVWSNNFQN